MTGSSIAAVRFAPKWSVTLLSKIAGGRSVGSSCSNGPQPRMGHPLLALLLLAAAAGVVWYVVGLGAGAGGGFG